MLSISHPLSSLSSSYLPLPSLAEAVTGDLTYYSPALGACGKTSGDNDDVVSIAHALFDAGSTGSDPNSNPLCGRRLRARRVDERLNAMRSIDLSVVDRCVGCQPTDIDVSPGAFAKLADPDRGRVLVTWAWLGSTPTATSRGAAAS